MRCHSYFYFIEQMLQLIAAYSFNDNSIDINQLIFS